MKVTRRTLIASGAGLATGLFLSRAEAATGSVALFFESAGFFLRGGNGTLSFRGRHYPLSVGGVGAGAFIGSSEFNLMGSALHLKRPSDIAGVYTATAAGGALAGAGRVATLSNAHGVVLRLHTPQMGLGFSIDLAGMSISLR